MGGAIDRRGQELACCFGGESLWLGSVSHTTAPQTSFAAPKPNKTEETVALCLALSRSSTPCCVHSFWSLHSGVE